VGAVLNANYAQMLDFMLGFTTLDIARDDGREVALWPWESEEDREPSPTAESIREEIFGLGGDTESDTEAEPKK